MGGTAIDPLGSGGTGGPIPPGDDQAFSQGGGCGCATGGTDAGSGAVVLALAGLFSRALVRRRRR